MAFPLFSLCQVNLHSHLTVLSLNHLPIFKVLLKTVSFSLCFWFSLIFFQDNGQQAYLSLSTKPPIANTNIHPLPFHLKLDSVPTSLVLIQPCDFRYSWYQHLKNLLAVVHLNTWTNSFFLALL